MVFDYGKFRKAKAIEKANKCKWLLLEPNLTEESGIYILTRVDENNPAIRYAYIGQAKHILTRLAQHLVGYQHIDLSLKKRGLYDSKNLYGWQVSVALCDITDLDDLERSYITQYAELGYQLYNKTIGGQDEGKTAIESAVASPKGYYDGKKKGYADAKKYCRIMFIKYLDFTAKKDGKIFEKKYNEFKEWLKEDGNS